MAKVNDVIATITESKQSSHPSAALTAPPPLKEFVDDERNTAAECLLKALPDGEVSLLRDLAYQTLQRPLWQVVLSHVKLALERGEAAEGVFDSSWEAGYYEPSQKLRCEFCQKDFIPTRFKQRFCSNQCAADYAKLLKSKKT